MMRNVSIRLKTAADAFISRNHEHLIHTTMRISSLLRGLWRERHTPRRLRLAFLLGLLPSVSIGAQPLAIPGTGDAIQILQALATRYNALHPQAPPIHIPPSIGSSGGIRLVIKDKAILARTARPLKPREQAAGLVALPWASYPVGFYTHPASGLHDIGRKQLEAIYRGQITHWGALGGGNERIRLIHREHGDSCRRILEHEMPTLLVEKDAPPSLTTVTTQATMEAVASYPGALAYGPYPELLDGPFHILSLDGISPDDPAYALHNTLYLVKRKGASLDGLAGFYRFLRSDEARRILREKGLQAIPLPEKAP